ncbi:DUF6058 family natural product biosynthesis protein [Streptomyces sp. NPDC056144]|uniref:DUF6058 family natural product biosynthesis protein n=1 Tax=unclassified Streptomyces TaxID=2593676 RepID=UPI0035D6962B
MPETRPEPTLAPLVAARFRAVNGDHPMSADDDAYVSAQFVTLDALCAELGRDPDAVRRLMLDGLLPLPGYLRSDGAEMVPRDLFRLADAARGAGEAGGAGGAVGAGALREWFVAHWEDPAEGAAEWEAYRSGQYVCLHTVTPATIRRKEELTAEISGAVASAPDTPTRAWLLGLHARVDELDALEPAFTGYDRLRFGGPTSRDTCIDAPRDRFPL